MKVPRPKPPIDVEEVHRLHLDEGLTLAEVARRLGFRASSIGRALRESGVRVRRRRALVTTEADRRLHITWRSMVGRCTRPSDPLYERYGARGGRVCEEWRDFAAFRTWARSSGWKPGLSLALEDRWRGYEPGNCTWISRSESIERGILEGPRGARWGITAFGETKSATVWAEDARCTVCAQGLLDRLNRGLAPEKAITMPRGADRGATTIRRRPARRRRAARPIDWEKVRDLYVEKGLDVSETALAMDVSYHGVLRGLQMRGWMREPADQARPDRLRHGRLLHKVWTSMRERCTSRAHPQFEDVGGRGVRVCRAWGDFGAFHAWAMRSGYQPGLCLARADRGRDYTPGNCEWLTRAEMARRARRAISSTPRWTIAAFGETKGPYAWSRDQRCSVSFSGLVDRLREGWKPEEAIVTPSVTGRSEPVVWVTAFGERKGVEDWVRDRRCKVGP